jgi:hypothetical protein
MRNLRLCLLTVLTAGLCAAGIPMASGAEEKPVVDLTLIPQDASGFVTLKVTGIWEEDSVKNMLKALEKKPDIFKEVEKFLGLELKQVERVSIMLPAGPNEEPLVILTTLKPFDQEKVRDAMAPNAEKKTIGTRSCYVGKSGSGSGGGGSGVYFANDRTFVCGQAKVLIGYLDKKWDISKDTRFKNATELIGQNTLIGMMDVSPFSKNMLKNLPPNLKETEALYAASPALFTVIGSKDSSLTGKLSYKDEGSAKDAEKAAIKTREALAKLIADEQKELAKEADRPEVKNDPFSAWATNSLIDLMKEVEDNVKKAKVTQKGNDIEVTIQSKVSGPRLAVAVFGSLFMTVSATESKERDPSREKGTER